MSIQSYLRVTGILGPTIMVRPIPVPFISRYSPLPCLFLSLSTGERSVGVVIEDCPLSKRIAQRATDRRGALSTPTGEQTDMQSQPKILHYANVEDEATDSAYEVFRFYKVDGARWDSSDTAPVCFRSEGGAEGAAAPQCETAIGRESSVRN